MSAVAVSQLGSSKEVLVQKLRANGSVCADELAGSLGVSKQCVRKHLEVLERDGYVEHTQVRRDRGRPSHAYSLTAKADQLFPKRYDMFAKNVLYQIRSVWGDTGLNAIFCGCAREMVQRIGPALSGLGFDERVQQLTSLLDREGYESSCEKLADGSYVLTERNCPMAEVARAYAQVCDSELDVYKELLGAEVVRDSRIASGASRCSYRISPPTA